MLYIILGILLVVLLLPYIYSTREGYEGYDEQSCQSLAKQNKTNLESLQKDVAKLMDLQKNILPNIQSTLDSNTAQIKSISETVYNLPK